jgi:integrase
MPKRTYDGIKKRCACRRKKWAKCIHPWHFSFHYGGVEHRVSLDRIARARGERRPTTKGDATKWRDRLRAEIRDGTFVEPAASPTVSTTLTLGDVADEYLKRHVRIPTRRLRAKREMETLIAVARRAVIPAAHGATVRLEEKPIDAITKADIEAIRTWRREEQAAGKSRPGPKGGAVGTNRLLSRLRHLFTWAITEGYLTTTPFMRGPVTVLKLETSVEGARTRRLAAGDQAALLTHADPHLRALLVAALTTGCRIGELLSLQWAQIRGDEDEPRWIDLPAAKTKTNETRTIPIGPRLRAELAMRRHAPDGKEHPPSAYVFGNAVGEHVASVRQQWEDAVLRAHGHAPVRKRGKLLTESRVALRAINLHIHDLRREFACSLLESGAALHDVQAFLGHGNITTTSRYLQSAPLRLEQALARMETAFAQDSHTETTTATSGQSTKTTDKSLN